MKRGPGPARKAPMKRGDPAKADAWRRRGAEKAQETARAALSRAPAPPKARTPIARRSDREKAPIDPERRIVVPERPRDTTPLPVGARRSDWYGAPDPMCVMCGRPGVRHHVVYEQEVRRADPRKVWDVRNRLDLCGEHHMGHHGPTPLHLWALHDENISFAFEVLGAGAFDYLQRRYAGDDARLHAALENFTTTTNGPASAGRHEEGEPHAR